METVPKIKKLPLKIKTDRINKNTQIKIMQKFQRIVQVIADFLVISSLLNFFKPENNLSKL
jgi:hypothetical protein